MNFVCFCSTIVPLNQKDMKIHIEQCVVYKSASPFFQQFEKLQIEKMQIPHLQALKSEFSIFQEKIDNLLTHQSSVNVVYNPYNSQYNQNWAPPPIPQLNQNASYQSQFNQTNDFQSTNELFKTSNLNKLFSKQEKCQVCTKMVDADIVTYFEHCWQPICRPCLMKSIEKDQKQDISIKCPNLTCRANMSESELVQLLGREKNDFIQQIMLEKQFNIVKCAVCEEKGSFERGSQITKLLDPITKQNLTQKYIDHYLNNRFVCVNSKCKSEQCKGCKAVPYHLGMTCEEYKIKKESKCCRYCDEPIHNVQNNIPKSLQDICSSKECQEKAQFACIKMLNCGHPCPGFKNEQQCSQCLQEGCCQTEQKGDDYCNICYVEGLKNAPVIQSSCGHIFHYQCIMKRLTIGWHGPRIVFKFCYCPLCNSWLEFQPSEPQTLLTKYASLLQDVMKKSLERLKYENREKDEKVSKPGEQFYQKPQEYSLAIYCYYLCFKCKQPYFGGAKDCQRALEEGDKQFKPEELICANCCEVPVGETCEKHGKDYIEFKCKFCCSIAVWFCWGTTHFCEDCHKRQCNGDYVSKYAKDKLPKCLGREKCPIKGDHKPNGEEQALGCAICRNAKANQMNF